MSLNSGRLVRTGLIKTGSYPEPVGRRIWYTRTIYSTISKIALLLVLAALSACSEEIVHGLSEAEANKILTGLNAVAITGEKVKEPDGSWAISVPEEQSLDALKILSETRLLPEAASDTPSSSGVLSSREDQKFRLERSISRDLEGTLRNIPGVLESRVHLNLPPTDPLFGRAIDGGKGSAAVLLVISESTLSREEVVSLVSGASGIDKTQISVVMSAEAPSKPKKIEASSALTLPAALPRTRSEGILFGMGRGTLLQAAASLLIIGFGLLWLFLKRGGLRGIQARSS